MKTKTKKKSKSCAGCRRLTRALRLAERMEEVHNQDAYRLNRELEHHQGQRLIFENSNAAGKILNHTLLSMLSLIRIIASDMPDQVSATKIREAMTPWPAAMRDYSPEPSVAIRT